jgi:hypothetical protein
MCHVCSWRILNKQTRRVRTDRPFLVNGQLDAQFFSMYLFQFSTCFEQPRANHQENQLYRHNIWYMSLCLLSVTFSCAGRRAHETVTDSKQSDVYQMLCRYSCFSWWLARGCSKHVENWNKYIEKNCASSWSFAKNHNKMHGQQNTKDRPLFSASLQPWSFRGNTVN